ncbi:MAG: hypothetical protein OXC91_07970, partial [Rhodobacteraceae bacterium]|nr:hypothetical protein [Paracoccaceae bacterium]
MNAFAGIGMGAIQTGLFLPRARDAGLESTLLVRDRRLAEGVERAGRIVVNVAGADGIVQEEVPGIGIRVLGDPDCCDDLVAAGEITIAVSTVSDYAGLAGLLAAAMGRKAAGEGPPCLLYACQNEAGAADSLTQAIMNAGGVGRMFQAVDMVIGKMSRTIRDAGECARLGLVPAFPGAGHAWLVEAYDTIHMSQVDRRKGVER